MLKIRNEEGNTLVGVDGLKSAGECMIDFKSGKNHVVRFSEGCIARHLRITMSGHNCRVEFAPGVIWSGRIIIAGRDRTISIGENTTAQGVYLLCRDANIAIGRDCMFSREIEIRTSDVHKIYNIGEDRQTNLPGDVVIGDRVWVAARAILSKGVRIPSGCVVGASSFVNKAFGKENAIIAGVPAKIIREGIRWVR